MIRKLLYSSTFIALSLIFVQQAHAQASTIETSTYNFANSDIAEIAVSNDSNANTLVSQEIDQVAITTQAVMFVNIFNNGFTHSSSDDNTPVSQPQQPAATLPQTTGSGGGATIITPDPGHVFASAISPILPNTSNSLTFFATIIAFLVFYASFGLRSYTGSSPPLRIVTYA